jgi:peptidoglycan/xylan/chitin deacetylase (PgdA/CDA1 family)
MAKKEKLVYITGDVHHTSYPCWEHREGYNKVFDYVREWCKILEENELKGTLFVTGKCLEENPSFWKKMAKRHDIGGHTYSAMDWYPFGMKFAFKKLFGSAIGPNILQAKEIRKTILAGAKAGLKITKWRTHAYAKINIHYLRNYGIKSCWDKIWFGGPEIMNIHGVEFIPQTFPEDHSNIWHKDLDDKRRGLMHPREFLDLVKQQFKIRDRLQVFQLHPTCMKCIDDFQMFDEIISEVKKIV